ncbi:MAG: hypothetical protein WCS52_16420 [bacterium]
MSRGNGRAAVFLEPADYGRFLEQLDHALEADQVVVSQVCGVYAWRG